VKENKENNYWPVALGADNSDYKLGNYHSFMETEDLLPYSQNPSARPFPKPDYSSPHSNIYIVGPTLVLYIIGSTLF
jgi:hypothetical protein